MKKLTLAFAFAILAVNTGFGAACDSACSFGPTPTLPWGAFNTTINFNARQAASVADAPTFLNPDATRLKGITPAANMPMIHLYVHDPVANGLGASGTQITYTAHVTYAFLGAAPALSHLFVLASNAGGLPTYVTSWTASVGVTSAVIDIKLDRPDTVNLVFGEFPSTTPAGMASGASPVIYDFAAPPSKVSLSLTGTSFRTANPLILATPVLAGSSTGKSVISGSYPTSAALLKSAIATLGVRTLGDSLKKDRFLSYYQRAFAADSAIATLGTVEKKPFTLNSVPDAATLSGAVSADSDVTVDPATGNLSATLPLNLSVEGWKALSVATPQISRGLEVVLTVFDGGTITRGKAFVRSKFGAGTANLQPGDRTVQFDHGCWNLSSYPWDEDSGSAKVRLVGGAGTTPQESNYRLMRYGGSSYVNLSQTDFSSYDDMGKAYWSGNSEGPYKPGSAGGKSLDYQTFSLPLTGGQWNDFGIPFNFPVRLKDVLDSTGTLGGHFIYHFVGANANAAGHWVRLEDTVSNLLLPWEGYTVKPAGTINLKIPVRDTSRSKYNSSAASLKTANSTLWLAGLRIQDQSAIADLQLSKGSRAFAIEEAPSVPGQDFRAVFHMGDSHWSAIQDESAQGMEGHWSLEVTPQKGFSNVRLGINERKGASVPIYLVETLRGTSVPLGDSSVNLTAADLQQGDFHIVAGSSTYVQSFLKSVTGPNQLNLVNFPNPFTEAGTSIRFSLPSTFSEVSYQVRIFDFQGRTVWEKSWKGGSLLNTYWDGKDLAGQRSPTGQYHLQVIAQAPGKSPFRAERNLIKLK